MRGKYSRALESLLKHSFIIVDTTPTVVTNFNFTFQIDGDGHIVKLNK